MVHVLVVKIDIIYKAENVIYVVLYLLLPVVSNVIMTLLFVLVVLMVTDYGIPKLLVKTLDVKDVTLTV